MKRLKIIIIIKLYKINYKLKLKYKHNNKI